MKGQRKEPVRALLPWILMPRYRNVISYINPNGIEVYVSATAPFVFVPGAASLLVTRYAHAQYVVEKSEETVTGIHKYYVRLEDVDAYVVGYVPDGTRIVYRKQLSDDLKGMEVEFEGRVSQDDIDHLVSQAARLKAGRYFGGVVASFAKRHGVSFTNHGVHRLLNVELHSENARAQINIKTYLYGVFHGGKVFRAPGVVPAIALILSYPNHFGSDLANSVPGYDEAVDIVSRMRDMGGKFSDMALLYNVSRARFSYIVGEVSNPPKRRTFITMEKVARGTRAAFFVDKSGRVLLQVSFLPASPPAMYVASFPPLNLAPLAAVVTDRFLKLKVIASRAEKAMKRQGFDATIYIDELEPLKDTKLTVDEVRGLMKDGYPLPTRVEQILTKLDKLSDIADILSLTSGGEIQKMLVKALEISKEEKEEKEKKRELMAEGAALKL